MHNKLTKLENLIWEYRRIEDDLFELRVDMEAGFSDPSDEFIKERELKDLFNQIKNFKWEEES